MICHLNLSFQTKNGLLESPTGTGKTLSILCSAMAWMDAENEKWLDVETPNPDGTDNQVAIHGGKPEDRVRVIYASRTHVQLSQAMKELQNSHYNTRSAIILGSRDQLCINEDVIRLDTNAAKTHACRTKTRTGACKYYDGYEPKVLSEYESLEVVDIEDLVHKGLSKNFCPYFASRLLKQKADVIFSPYNYLLDPALRRIQGIDLKNCVVIFDEGHNIEQNCEDCASSELRSLTLEICIKEIDNQLTKNNNSAGPVAEFKRGDVITSDSLQSSLATNDKDEAEIPELSAIDLLNGKNLLTQLKDALFQHLEVTKGSKNNKVDMDWFFKLLKNQLRLDRDSVDRLLAIFDKMSLSLAGTSSHPAGRLKIASFDSIGSFLRAIFPTDLTPIQYKDFEREFRLKYAITLEEENTSFKRFQEKKDVYTTITEGTATKSWTLNLYCLSPSVAMTQLIKLGVKCVVITSGTLSPLDSFESEMEIAFPVKLENKHVVEDNQVMVLAVDGRDNVQFDSRFTNRSNEQYPLALGQSIIEYCRIIPDGILVFFSSYAVLRKTQEFWQLKGIWDRLGTLKACFVEPTDKLCFNEYLSKFKENVDDGKGSIFFGVCRGKLSEGLDIANSYCRAVIMLGIPYTSCFDNKSILKREYIEKKKDPKYTHDIHYAIQMKRSLNQAVGRIIRHKHDFGAVLLLDFRFAQHQNSLSKWLRPYFQKVNYSESRKKLETFFDTNVEKKNIIKRAAVTITSNVPDNKLFAPFVQPLITVKSSVTSSTINPKVGELRPKTENFFPIFDKQANKTNQIRNSSPGPEKKKITSSRSSPYFLPERKSSVSSPKSSSSGPLQTQQSNDMVMEKKEFYSNHSHDMKQYLLKTGQMASLTAALTAYRANRDVPSLASRVTTLFRDVQADQRHNFYSGISSLITDVEDREVFISLSRGHSH